MHALTSDSTINKFSNNIVIFFTGAFAEVKNKKVDVLTSRGDKYLGGRDFDKEITKLMKIKYHDVHKVDIDIENKKEYLQKAEEVKKILSVKNKASISIDGPKGPQQIEITLEEFEESIQTYIEKIKMLIEEAMEASGMKPSRINQTLLVGGSTRIPLITKVLTNIMGKPPVKGVNVDEAVVCGAAIYAGLKTEKKILNNQSYLKLWKRLYKKARSSTAKHLDICFVVFFAPEYEINDRNQRFRKLFNRLKVSGIFRG